MSTPIAPTAAAGTGLSIADEAHAPAAVRNGSATVKHAYASAQDFEEMLLQQLSQSMLQSSGLGGEGGGEGEESSGSSGEGGMLTSLLPQALTEGVMREGGLGLATQLMSSLDPAAGTAATGAIAAGGAVAGGAAAGGTAAGVSAAGATPAAGTAPTQSASGGSAAGTGTAAAGASVNASGGVAA
jgi:Rod binding domain-containing protein